MRKCIINIAQTNIEDDDILLFVIIVNLYHNMKY